MTVFVAFRRGNWLYRMLRGFWQPSSAMTTSRWARLTRWISHATQPDSWMECALYYKAACGASTNPAGCAFCRRKLLNTPGPTALAQHPHLIAVSVDPHRGVCLEIDKRLEKGSEAWMFLHLSSLSDQQAADFTRAVQARQDIAPKYNMRGILYNLLPFGHNYGVQLDCDWRNQATAHGFFCSELITTFLQTHGFERMGLVPCQTTPQQLLSRLLAAYPALARTQQLRMLANGTGFVNDVVRFHALAGVDANDLV
jgi:hypothetical protein